MFRLIRKVETNIEDARLIGLRFLARHLRPWAKRHQFSFGGKPVTIRGGSTDARIVRYLLNEREYQLEPEAERQVRARYDRIVEEGKTPIVIDAGGNIGLTAIWFSHSYPAAKIVTIEPDPGNFAILSENVSRWPNVIATRSALGGEAGSANVAGEEEWGYQTTRSESGDTPIITVRQAADLAGPNTSLFIVKVDIEGFEAEVFDGECAWIDEAECVMIEPHDWLRPTDATSRSFQREMGKRDFSLYLRGNNLIYVRRWV